MLDLQLDLQSEFVEWKKKCKLQITPCNFPATMQKRACMYAIETHIASQLHYKMPLFISVPCSKHSDPLDPNFIATSQPPPGVIQKKCVLQADSKLPNSSIKYHGLHSHRQGEGSRPDCGGKISHCKMGTLSHLSIIVHHQPLILKYLYKAIA